MSESIQLRQTNPDETEKMAQYESANGEAVCASYIARAVAAKLGEFAELVVSEEADVMAELDGVSGNGSGNYAVYETPSELVTGLYLSHDVWAEVTGEDAEPENAPESIGLTFKPSNEETFEEAVEEQESVDEEEVEGLVAGDVDDTDEDETEDEPEEVEIADEEIGLVEE